MTSPNKIKKPMPWSERFALIEHFKPTDEQVCNAFGLSQDELDTARALLDAGTLLVKRGMDLSNVENIFTAVESEVGIAQRAATAATRYAMPETASRPVRAPAKRGRKGTKITDALLAVPLVSIPVDDFVAQHGVSIAVLRQSRRFAAGLPDDVRQSFGTVHVRQDKATKRLMIWREVPKA